MIYKLDKAEFQQATTLALEVYLQRGQDDFEDEGLESFKSFIFSDKLMSELCICGAFEENKLIGIMGTESEGKHISLLFIEKGSHRKGIGKQLFDYPQCNCPANEITINSSTYAIRLYRPLGFERTNDRRQTSEVSYTLMKLISNKQGRRYYHQIPVPRSPNLITNYTFEYVFLIKIVSIFATVMAKYIFCILFGILLVWGCNLVPDKELQEFRTEADTTTIQSHNKSQSYRSKAVVKQSGKGSNSLQEEKYDGGYDCNIIGGILGNPLLPHTTSPSRILRFNISSATIWILSSLRYQFPREKWTGLPYYIDLTKFSYRYYIYTLGRVLI